MKRRVVRFYTVGAAGAGVQLAALALLAHGTGLHHSLATALAVEIAVIHNFCWHEHWTWASGAPGAWKRFWKFNVSTGFISVAANVVITTTLVELCGMPGLIANAMAIALTSFANYLASDVWVFRTGCSWEPDGTLARASRNVQQPFSVFRIIRLSPNRILHGEPETVFRSAGTAHTTTGLTGPSGGGN